MGLLPRDARALPSSLSKWPQLDSHSHSRRHCPSHNHSQASRHSRYHHNQLSPEYLKQMKKMARGVCTTCLRSISLSVSGLVRVHGPVAQRCPGSAQQPQQVATARQPQPQPSPLPQSQPQPPPLPTSQQAQSLSPQSVVASPPADLTTTTSPTQHQSPTVPSAAASTTCESARKDPKGFERSSLS